MSSKAWVVAVSFIVFTSSSVMAQSNAPLTPKSTPVVHQPMPADKALPLAKQYALDFLEGRAGLLWDKLTPEMKSIAGGDQAKWIEICAAIPPQIGHVKQ